ncbi:hypothetical protein GCM10007190_16630 [Macrococcus hajekii]|nr:helix-turn-helix domain-containing protein [Macrococcus hajekii]GGB09228.1 hypothetical protein GCM10007190_16630 [Macrococcus hajekii]
MEIEQMVKIHKALGDRTRYLIMQSVIKNKSICPGMLCEEMQNVASSTMSHHLRLLADSGLIIPEKQGTYIFYRPNQPIVDLFFQDI